MDLRLATTVPLQRERAYESNGEGLTIVGLSARVGPRTALCNIHRDAGLQFAVESHHLKTGKSGSGMAANPPRAGQTML